MGWDGMGGDRSGSGSGRINRETQLWRWRVGIRCMISYCICRMSIHSISQSVGESSSESEATVVRCAVLSATAS